MEVCYEGWGYSKDESNCIEEHHENSSPGPVFPQTPRSKIRKLTGAFNSLKAYKTGNVLNLKVRCICMKNQRGQWMTVI